MTGKKEKNLKFIKGKDGKPGYYRTEITLNYRHVRRFAGYTKEEAKTYLGKLRIAARQGKLDEIIKPKRPGDNFGEYARALLDSADWKQKRSAWRNEFSLKNLNRFFKSLKLDDINSGQARRYITERSNQGASPATINREISLLKSILYAAEFDGLIASNPIRGRRVKKLEENNSREKTILGMNLADKDLFRLIECAEPSLKPILEIALITGMRKGEILKMRWKDVDFRLGIIRIPVENSKTKQERLIPIDSNLIAEFDSIEKKGEYVFMSDLTGDRKKRIEGAFKAACEEAGIPCGRKGGLTFHDLRHLAASRLVKMTDVVTAAKILGHSELKTTLRYVHPTEKDKRLAVEKASEFLFQGRQKDVNGQKSAALEELEIRAQIN